MYNFAMTKILVVALSVFISSTIFAAGKASNAKSTLQYKMMETNNKTKPYLEKYTWDVYETEISYPLFTGKPKALVTELNAFVDERLKDANCDADVLEDFSKKSKNAEKIGGWHEKLSVIRLDQNIVTLENSYDTYCAGTAHHETGKTHHIFLVSTGKQIDMKNHIAEEGKVVDAYIEKYKKIDASKTGGDCQDYMNAAAMHGLGFDYEIGSKNVEISPNFPHALKACAVQVQITFDEFKDFLTESSELRDFI